MSDTTETIQTIVPRDMYEDLMREAESEHRTLSQMVRVIILRYFEGKPHGKKRK